MTWISITSMCLCSQKIEQAALSKWRIKRSAKDCDCPNARFESGITELFQLWLKNTMFVHWMVDGATYYEYALLTAVYPWYAEVPYTRKHISCLMHTAALLLPLHVLLQMLTTAWSDEWSILGWTSSVYYRGITGRYNIAMALKISSHTSNPACKSRTRQFITSGPLSLAVNRLLPELWMRSVVVFDLVETKVVYE